jgi:type IV pilus assembly protein PilA
MADLIRKRMTGKEEGFTLIELLVVVVILGILMAIAVPSYMGFRDRAEQKAASANVRSALPAVEAYYSDHGDYAFSLLPTGVAAGTAIAALQAIDSGIKLTAAFGTAAGVTPAKYCVSNKQGTHYSKVVGPGGTIDESIAADCTSATS